jgi:capsular polysaccharide biosynthesis protein
MSAPSFDPEAEQEVDFGRYLRLLAAAGGSSWPGFSSEPSSVAVAPGGTQTFKAIATLYLGQPYSASGNVSSRPRRRTEHCPPDRPPEIVIDKVAAQCKAKPGDFRGGISTQTISGSIVRNGQTPLVSVAVQAKKRRLAACVANGLAREVVDRLVGVREPEDQQLPGADHERPAQDQRNQRGASELVAVADRQARPSAPASSAEDAKLSTSQLLLQASQVEKPKILTGAAAQKVTARSRRNTLVVSALIGLVLGAIVALLWDGVAAGLARRKSYARGQARRGRRARARRAGAHRDDAGRVAGVRRPRLRRRRRLG